MKRTTFLPILILYTSLLCASLDSYAHPGKVNMAGHAMAFVENKGQIIDQNDRPRNDIDFKIESNGLNMFVGKAAIHYQWNHRKDNGNKAAKEVLVDMYRMDVELVGANKNARVTREDRQHAFRNYYLPQTPNGARVNEYGKITYKNVYPNIDWVLYISNKKTLKYDFVVHKGGNPADIKLKYTGATELVLKNGEITATTPMGSIHEAAPVSYIRDGEKVTSSYKLTGDVLSFELDAYEAGNKDLIIDPVIGWSTYFGNSGNETGFSVATDTSGNAYMVGITNSSSGIAINGPAAFAGYRDKFDGYIAAYDGDGAMQWSNYYGGQQDDNLYYVTADTLGNVYACGITASSASGSNISTAGAHQTSYGGGSSDAYIVKFRTSNGARVWGTYYGGGGDEAKPASFEDYMVSIEWDKKTNSIYLCGNTASTSGISYGSNAWQASRAGTSGEDGYLVKFDADGVRQWGTYFGGTTLDKITKVRCDKAGNIYVTGETTSGSGIAYGSSPHQAINLSSNPANPDAFLAKFNTAGQQIWGTYYGGGDIDQAFGVATDADCNVYIAGSTLSSSPTGAISTSNSLSGAVDAFLVKFDSAGVRLWGTYFGGTAADNTADIAIDGTGNVCFSGSTKSGTGIALGRGAITTPPGGTLDAFLAVYSPSGRHTWGTYFGGTGEDYAQGISYSRKGDLLVAGYTNSMSGIATTGAYQSLLGLKSNGDPSQDGFLCKFKADTAAFIITPITLTYCQGDSIHIPYGITNPFKSPNTFTLQLSDASGIFGASPTVLGTLTSSVPGVIHGKIPATPTANNKYRVRIVSTNPVGESFDNGADITIRPTPASPTFTTNSPACSGTPLNFTANTTSTNSGITYTWKGPLGFSNNTASSSIPAAAVTQSGYYAVTLSLAGCSIKDSVQLTVTPAPTKPVITGTTVLCTGETIKLNATATPSTVTYEWAGPTSFSATTQAAERVLATPLMSGYYVATATLGSCSKKDSVMVSVKPSLTPSMILTADPGVSICIGDRIIFTANINNGGTSPTFKWFRNGIEIPNATLSVFTDSVSKDDDSISCVFYSNEACLTRSSDAQWLKISVAKPQPPEVTVTAVKNYGPPGDFLRFKTISKYGGTNPSFKWFVWHPAGHPKAPIEFIPGAYVDSVDLEIGYIINPGDSVYCMITSTLSCTDPKVADSKNKIPIVENVGVRSNSIANTLHFYPNPNNGNFTINGTVTSNAEVDVQIINALGQLVHRESITPTGKIIDHKVTTGALAEGVYLLRLRTGEDAVVWRMVVDDKQE